MIEKIRCIDASAKQLAIISNGILKKSPRFAQQAYEKNIINSFKPRFTQEGVKNFYNIQDFYEKTGEIKKDAKPIFAKILEDFGLHKDTTLGEFAGFIIGTYK